MDTIIVDWNAALLGGLVGTIAMTAFWYALRAAGWMQLDWGQLLGTFFYPPGHRALAVGLVWHLLTGLLFGLVYAVALSDGAGGPNAVTGLMLGVLHAAVAVALLYPLSRVHPVLSQMRPPQPWSGRDRVLYALGFPLFGAVFGGTYSRYVTWVSAEAMDPARFWLTVFAIIAIVGLVGLATYRLIPPWREESGPIFAAAEPTIDERRRALREAHEAGRVSAEDLALGLEDLELEERG